MNRLIICLALLYPWLVSCASADNPLHYDYEVIAERDHPILFTQGLLLHDGYFYESSGLYGRSRLVRYRADVNAESTLIAHSRTLPQRYFAEGLALFDDQLYQLTWRENTLLIYDRESFDLQTTRHYPGEGWGLTEDGQRLIRSDGSDQLFFHAPDSFELLGQVAVHEAGRPVRRINELAYVDGRVWANIWKENRIIAINPDSGTVDITVDLSDLAAQIDKPDSQSVLNGIAYDPEQDAFWVTGKNWPRLFLIRLVPPH
ncbi:glutaminyl-peptide cyclotransferase [Marinimicrobium alkaliphilum]|uniref:glutaminyl-peptide cyclotransferase n=1 Tax=Marinimicrobium alkaliphilum TaxID=2202654 RepID=UPI000DBAD09E|nr:glutaminyl-peptide cyclotransferase [Marinimicrobium alkaliphilum]